MKNIKVLGIDLAKNVGTVAKIGVWGAVEQKTGSKSCARRGVALRA